MFSLTIIKSFLSSNITKRILELSIILGIVFILFKIKDDIFNKTLLAQQQQLILLNNQLKQELANRDIQIQKLNFQMQDLNNKLNIMSASHIAALNVITHKPIRPSNDSTITSAHLSPDCIQKLDDQYDMFMKRETVLTTDLKNTEDALNSSLAALSTATEQVKKDSDIIDTNKKIIAAQQKQLDLAIKELNSETTRKKFWRDTTVGMVIITAAKFLL